MKTKIQVILTSILMMFFIAGCANAGKDQSVKSGVVVTLDGSASTSMVNGPIIRYKWEQLKGTTVQLEDENAVKTTFVAPNVDKKTELVFKLSAFENKYGKEFPTSDEVIINILPNAVVENEAPKAVIFASSASIKVNESISFNAISSSDSDGTIVSYEWKNGDTVLSTEESFEHTFNNAGTSTISLKVTDNDGASDTHSLNITVKGSLPPVAKITVDKTSVTIIETITFDANLSSDSDGNIVSYKWLDENKQTLGTEKTLLLDYPTVGEYTVELVVTDDDGLTSSDSVNIRVMPRYTHTKISIVGNSSDIGNIKVGETLQLQAIDHYNDKSTIDKTNQMQWTYSNQFISIDTKGLVTALEKGQTIITGLRANSVTINVADADTGVSVSGVIRDVDKKAIQGARVTIGSTVETSDSNGNFSFSNLEKTERISINVIHPDYMANSRVVITTAAHQSFTQDIVLTRAKASITFDSSVATTLEQPVGSYRTASVALPANGYVDSEGNPYVGQVIAKMSYFPISTREGQAAFPGTYEGINGNETFPIESFGFMNVELTDPSGRELNLAPGSSATLTYPTDVYTSRTTIPLWYYDTTLGYWVEEGQAQKVGYSSFVGTVTHFTSWNLDAKGPASGKVQVCVVDESNNKVANASVQFTSVNWLSYSLQTDSNGELAVHNALAGKALTVTAAKLIAGNMYYGEYPSTITLAEGADKTLSSCIVLEDQGAVSSTNTIRVKGRAVNFSDQPVSNVNLDLSGGNSIPTDANGYFDSVIPTPNSLSLSIGDGECNTRFTLQANKSVYDLGNISVCMF